MRSALAAIAFLGAVGLQSAAFAADDVELVGKSFVDICLSSQFSAPRLEQQLRSMMPLAGGVSISDHPPRAQGNYFVGKEEAGFIVKYTTDPADAAAVRECSVGVYTASRQALIEWIKSNLSVSRLRDVTSPYQAGLVTGLLGELRHQNRNYSLVILFTLAAKPGRDLVMLTVKA
jgi:hypothetical protein